MDDAAGRQQREAFSQVGEARDQVVVLAVHEKQRVEAAHPFEGGRAHHPGGGVDAADVVPGLHAVQAGVRQVVRRVALQVAGLGLRIEAGQIGAAVQRRDHAVVGVRIEEGGQLAQRRRGDEGILIEQENVIGMVVDGAADTDVVADAESAVVAAGDQQRFRVVARDDGGGVVGRSIVDDNGGARRFAGAQGIEGAANPGRAVVGDDDDVDLHGVVVKGAVAGNLAR